MGSARYIDKGSPPDSRFNQFGNIATNNVFAESNAKNISTKNNNYITTRQGIFTGAFGSSESNLTIESGGILDITQNTTGEVPIRRTIHINPYSGTTDTLIGIETDANELPYQELFLIGVAGDTITITHNSGSVSGTERAILCAGDTDYTLSGDEIVHLIYDTSLTKWIVLNSSSAGDDLGNHTATTTLNLNSNNINNANIIYGGAGTGSTVDFGATMSLSASTNMNLSDSAGIFLNSDQSAVAVEFLRKVRPYTNNIDLGDPTHKWGDIYFQSGTGTSKIYLDGGGDTYITGSATSGRINIYNDGTNRTAFTTSGFSVLSNDVTDIGTLKFDSTGTPAAAETSISSLGGNLYYNVLATNDSHFFEINGTSEVEIDADGLDIKTGWLELFERSAPTGLSNHARLYAKDNGAGKTQLVVIFGTGAEQVIATEP